ncbi:MAG TPA: sugar ABC transporter substrate-binding protein [Bacteroidota bacterium]|nr:MAG: hypothetical protein A2X67_02835 [Ignavibacteria bacterium GWA2_55_11]OGU44855.1 MAG: hypothetical protein A2X68_12650 [Ignavibacteria bacterium GWC2_56_12]HLA69237.1 sugar ABC transporter substrate-binding protein [Bacteroidota bacterium]
MLEQAQLLATSKRFLWCAVLIVVAASCRHEQGSEVLVTFWAMGAEGERVQTLIPEFERRNPGIRVKVQAIPWTAAHEKLLTAYAGTSTPDVAQLGNTWIPEFTTLEALENLDPWIGESTVIRNANYFQGFWETNVIQGSVYGIPWYCDTRVLFYRRDILTHVGYPSGPATWDELLEASVKIKAMDKSVDRYAIFLPTNEWNVPVIMGLQAGSPILKDRHQYGDFSGTAFRKAFELYIDLFRKGLAPSGLSQMTNVYLSFAEGYFSMYVTGPWNVGEFRRRMPANLRDQWMTAPIPGFAGNIPGISLAGGSSLVMFKSSTRKAEAWKFIEFLSEPEQQVAFYRLTGDLPPGIKAWEDTVLVNDPHLRAFRTQLQHVEPTPRIPEWEQIAIKVQEYAEAVSMNRMTVDQALAALDRDADRILEKRRWLLAQE